MNDVTGLDPDPRNDPSVPTSDSLRRRTRRTDVTSRNLARHRSAHRPTTPLAPMARAAAASVGSAARRGAVVAAGSGLLISVIATPADATPGTELGTAVSTVDVSALTEQAREALRSAPVVTVAADAAFSVEQAAVTVTPAPAPKRTSTTTTSRTSTTPVPASAAGSAVVSVAFRYLGVPYLWGGTTPDGFDCSGFTRYVYAQIGINLPRTSSEQRYAGTVISRAEAQPGDMIWSPGHIAIYAGDNMQIEAPVPGKTVRYSTIWQSNPTFIRLG